MPLRRIAALLTLSASLALGSAARAEDPTPAPSPSPEYVTTESGLRYVDHVVGTGPMPKKGQRVDINYEIRIGDRRVEKSPAGTPFSFYVGEGMSLKGLDEGVSTMRAGGKRTVTVPPKLGYGAQDIPKVPPNSTLTIDLELLKLY